MPVSFINDYCFLVASNHGSSSFKALCNQCPTNVKPCATSCFDKAKMASTEDELVTRKSQLKKAKSDLDSESCWQI